MRKTRRPNLTPIRPLASVRNQENTHLSLGRFDSAVCLSRRDAVSLAEEQKVVDESLHVFLHGGTRRGRDLVVFDLHGAGRHIVEALDDDAERLAELLHTAEIAVVAVAVYTDGNVELDLVVGIIRLGLADVPGDAGTAEHGAGERVVNSVSGGDDTYALCAADPDTVVSEHFLGFVKTVAELSGPLVDVVEEAHGEILRDTARADVGGVETGAGNALVEFLLIEVR